MFKTGMIVDKKYKVLSLAGRGGSGEVYLAFDMRENNFLAIKKIKSEKEAEILRKFHSPAFPKIRNVDVYKRQGRQRERNQQGKRL